MKNYWKYIVISLLAGVVVFHLTAVSFIWRENYELTSPDYYNQELGQDAHQAAIRAGNAFTWETQVQRDRVTVAARDLNGALVDLSDVTVHFYKPDQADQDQLVALNAGNNAWTAALNDIPSGKWRITVNATHGQEKLAYRTAVGVR